MRPCSLVEDRGHQQLLHLLLRDVELLRAASMGSDSSSGLNTRAGPALSSAQPTHLCNGGDPDPGVGSYQADEHLGADVA